MAEGFLKSLDDRLEVYSAGTDPEGQVNPRAVQVMREKGIDISSGKPQGVNEFVHRPFDYVITVCDGAKEKCPVFAGEVKHRLHIGFDDPAQAEGTEEEIMRVFRRVRDEIFHDFGVFYENELKHQLK
jgi:arsenate reductase